MLLENDSVGYIRFLRIAGGDSNCKGIEIWLS